MSECEPSAPPAFCGTFCTLCGNTNVAELGRIIGICLDGDACRQRQIESATLPGARGGGEVSRWCQLGEHEFCSKACTCECHPACRCPDACDVEHE